MNKKILGILFIAAIINTILTFFIVLEATSLKDDDTNVSLTERAINDIQDLDEDYPGAGEYALLELGGAMIGDFFALMIYAMIVIIVPNTANCITTILMLIGLLFQIGKIKKWKLIIGIITLSLSIVAGFIEVAILAFFIKSNVLLILITLLLNCALVLGMVYGVVRFVQRVNYKEVEA